MTNNIKNKNGGFGILKLIIFIIIVIFLMNYFHITISGIINWFGTMLHNIF
ncbi:hypothetical protein KKA39_00870 [Patescibacteria group bacterium]|nr:hypothetical protein [Patescibacteria group bacterium]MBU1727846.1 hypothetical protein [Patescibacteria group bacterium]